MKVRDAYAHARGESQFIDDIPEPEGTLHAAVFASPEAHARISALDTSAALGAKGVSAVFTASGIPGENEVGGIIRDEPLLADEGVHYIGQPIALVVADTKGNAHRAAALIEADFEELPAVFDPRRAAAAGDLIAPSRTFSIGDVDSAWADCSTIVAGSVESGGQEHLYLETQGALAVPDDGGGVKVISATQSPTSVQRTVAGVLGIPMNLVEVDVKRLGGAFGGKEDQATPWAALAALAAYILGRPVKIVLGRGEDMRMTGKRHPYSSDFRIGLDRSGKILAYEATFFQNAGAAADLSTAILERSLFHATNSYRIPNARVTGLSCRTNLPPFTAFRGFGGPQAIFVVESAIAHAAEAVGVDAAYLQEKNLLDDGDRFPYGMAVENCRARQCFQEACERFDVAGMRRGVREFNDRNRILKQGLSLMPVCFGISFTSSFLNQAGALVHVYTDGSVQVSTGAVEMGQGVNAKIQSIAARTLGVPAARVMVASTNTQRVANTSPTAASTGADMNGMAARLACEAILARLVRAASVELDLDPASIEIRDGLVRADGEETDLVWERLVRLCYLGRVNLSAQAHYATPGVFFDREKEQGRPFAYHVFGTAVIRVTVDCLRGTHRVEDLLVVHDAGRSLHPLIDRGQVEGAAMQGIGWMTMEELVYEEGRLLTDSLTTYKVPDVHAVSERVEVVFLEDAENRSAVLNSKAIGEPPFMYGIGAYFAILNAMRAFRPEREGFYKAPMTPERALLYLYGCDEGPADL